MIRNLVFFILQPNFLFGSHMAESNLTLISFPSALYSVWLCKTLYPINVVNWLVIYYCSYFGSNLELPALLSPCNRSSMKMLMALNIYIFTKYLAYYIYFLHIYFGRKILFNNFKLYLKHPLIRIQIAVKSAQLSNPRIVLHIIFYVHKV